jgi:hypothetical protein
MPKVVYNSSQGLVQQAGSGIQFSELPFSPVQAITATGATIAAPGVYTVSGASALTTTVPDPASFPGSMLIVRAVSDKAHILTGSAAVAGVSIFRSSPTNSPLTTGQKFTFASAEGATVTLISDGLAYSIAAGSGSIS